MDENIGVKEVFPEPGGRFSHDELTKNTELKQVECKEEKYLTSLENLQMTCSPKKKEWLDKMLNGEDVLKRAEALAKGEGLLDTLGKETETPAGESESSQEAVHAHFPGYNNSVAVRDQGYYSRQVCEVHLCIPLGETENNLNHIILVALQLYRMVKSIVENKKNPEFWRIDTKSKTYRWVKRKNIGFWKNRFAKSAIRISKKLAKCLLLDVPSSHPPTDDALHQCCKKNCLHRFSVIELTNEMLGYELMTFAQRKEFLEKALKDKLKTGSLHIGHKSVCFSAHQQTYGYGKNTYYRVRAQMFQHGYVKTIDERVLSTARKHGSLRELIRDHLGAYINDGHCCFDPGDGTLHHGDRVSKNIPVPGNFVNAKWPGTGRFCNLTPSRCRGLINYYMSILRNLIW